MTLDCSFKFFCKLFLFNLLKSFLLLGKHYNIDYSQEKNELKELLVSYDNITQAHLNRWHRQFTTLSKFTNPFITVQTYTDTPKDVIEHAIHEINNNTHLLETLTYPKLKRLIKC